VENVGPLTTVRPGQTLWLDQTLDILQGVKLTDEGPDAWIAALQRGH
jgi:hypothetical protein